MADLGTLVEMARAWFRFDNRSGGNELFLDSKPNTNDPTKIRQGTFDPGNWLGAFSFDFLTGDPTSPRREEKVLIGGKLEADGGCLEVFCQKPNTDDDAGMVRIMRISNSGIEMFGRKVADAGGLIGGGNGPASRFYSDDRKFCYNVQGDAQPGAPFGRIIQYDTKGTSDESKWVAVGQMKPSPL